MTDEANQIPWGPLGREWWTDTGTRLGASEQQIAFAACMHAGSMSQKQAAILAGYASETDRKAIQSGSSAAATRQVMNLQVMARAELKNQDLPEAPSKPFSQAEWTQRLEDIARGPDPKLAMAAGQMLFDGKQPAAEIGAFAVMDDGFVEWRIVRDYLRIDGGAVAIASIYSARGMDLAGAALLHDLVDRLRRDDPEFYELLRRRQSKIGLVELDQRLADANYQRAARQKLWLEVGVDIDATAPMNSPTKAPAQPGAEARQTQAAARPINAHSSNGAAAAGALEFGQ